VRCGGFWTRRVCSHAKDSHESSLETETPTPRTQASAQTGLAKIRDCFDGCIRSASRRLGTLVAGYGGDASLGKCWAASILIFLIGMPAGAVQLPYATSVPAKEGGSPLYPVVVAVEDVAVNQWVIGRGEVPKEFSALDCNGASHFTGSNFFAVFEGRSPIEFTSGSGPYRASQNDFIIKDGGARPADVRNAKRRAEGLICLGRMYRYVAHNKLWSVGGDKLPIGGGDASLQLDAQYEKLEKGDDGKGYGGPKKTFGEESEPPIILCLLVLAASVGGGLVITLFGWQHFYNNGRLLGASLIGLGCLIGLGGLGWWWSWLL
jgi:hypothetical protein